MRGGARRGRRGAVPTCCCAAARCSAMCPAALPAPGPAPGPALGPARRAGGAAAPPGSPRPLPAARSRRPNTCAAPAPSPRLCTEPAPRHILLWAVFFFFPPLFFFFPPLNLARAKPEATSFPPLRTQRVTTPTAGRAGSRRGENPSGRRTRSTGELRPAKRPLTYCPGSAEPQTLYAASRELPTRAAGQRQAQAAPAPPLRLPPLRLPIYIHLPAAGGARTVYSSSAAGSSQLGTSPPARRYICGRRRDARGPGRSPLPARRGRPRPRAVAGVPQLLGVTAGLRPGRALGAPCKPAEHPAGLKSVKCGVQGLRNCPGRGRG